MIVHFIVKLLQPLSPKLLTSVERRVVQTKTGMRFGKDTGGNVMGEDANYFAEKELFNYQSWIQTRFYLWAASNTSFLQDYGLIQNREQCDTRKMQNDEIIWSVINQQ
jgi:hypothetical protein